MDFFEPPGQKEGGEKEEEEKSTKKKKWVWPIVLLSPRWGFVPRPSVHPIENNWNSHQVVLWENMYFRFQKCQYDVKFQTKYVNLQSCNEPSKPCPISGAIGGPLPLELEVPQ
jgi:hypothetical protein